MTLARAIDEQAGGGVKGRPVDVTSPPGHLKGMVSFDMRWPPRRPTVIDMTADGRFTQPRSPLANRVFRIAVLVAVAAGAFAVAALLLYLALALIPIAIGAALIAYAAYRWQAWRAGRGSAGDRRDLYRP